jgi:hypothetical protein
MPHNDPADLFRPRIETLAKIIDRESVAATIESHGWILTDAMGRGIMFDVVAEGGKFRATTTGFGPVERVSRFTQRDAFALMKAVLGATAIHWRDAVQHEHDGLVACMQMFENHGATHA